MQEGGGVVLVKPVEGGRTVTQEKIILHVILHFMAGPSRNNSGFIPQINLPQMTNTCSLFETTLSLHFSDARGISDHLQFNLHMFRYPIYLLATISKNPLHSI